MIQLCPAKVTGGFLAERYDRRVSNVPPSQPELPAWPTAAPPARSQPSRWLGVLSLGIALLAIGIAIGAWFRPLPKNELPPAPVYTSQQVADAKAKVCGAYERVREALAAAGARGADSDPTASLAIATSSRQALDVSSRYLMSKLAAAPATPADLATAIRKLASVYEELTISYLADSDDSVIIPLRRAAEEPTSAIDRFCK